MIRWAEDLGAPAVVAAANIAVGETKPEWERPVGIGLALVGYVLGGAMGMGGNFVKNIGIAAAPWALTGIYDYVRGAIGGASGVVSSPSRLRLQPAAVFAGANGIARHPAPAYVDEFEGVRLS